MIKGVALTPEEIGDCLDLEIEATYPCSEGGVVSTVSVDKLLQAQLAKALVWFKEMVKGMKVLSDEEIRGALDKTYLELEQKYGANNMREDNQLRQKVVNEYNDGILRNTAQAQLQSCQSYLLEKMKE